MSTSEQQASVPPAPGSARRLLTPLNIATLATFVLGVVWRCVHILKLHDPRSYVDSDMKMYVNLAKRFATPGFVPTIGDITHPPATGMLFSWFFRHDESFKSLVHFQTVIACLVPLAVGAFALAVFDRRTAKWAVIASCLYYPFIDYGGYFLSEVYMMLLNPLAAALFVTAAKQKTLLRVAVVGLVAGVVFWLAMAFKMVAFPSMLGFCALYWLFSTDATRKWKTVAVVALFLGAAPGTAMLSARCTKANEGHFCLVSNKAPADFLLGHYGRIQGLAWKDSRGRITVQFGSPAAYQRGYREVPSVPFLITDGPQNSAYAWRWIGQHPVEAFILSCEHVYDSFCGSLPWPSVANGFWAISESYHFIFLLFLLLPSLMRCLDVIRRQGFRRFLESRELLVLSLVFGLVAAVFVATGEERYRMPYDSVFILLAIRFYIGFKLPGLTPADVVRENPDAPIAALAAIGMSAPAVVAASDEKPIDEKAVDEKAVDEAPSAIDEAPIAADEKPLSAEKPAEDEAPAREPDLGLDPEPEPA